MQESDQNLVQMKKPLMSYACRFIKEPFQILASTLLSLLIPLSYILLSRLSIIHNLVNLHHNFPVSFLLYGNPSLLHLLVSIVSIVTLFSALTGQTARPGRATLYPAWIFLCAMQLCVGMGVKLNVGPVSEKLGPDFEKSLLSKVVFFLGLHETTLHWWRMVVKPVVDDTLFGAAREERWAERVAMAVGLGGLWWWRLKSEVVSLVVVAEVKKEFSMEVGLVDFLGWWLYYVTVTIGLVRVVKSLIWFGIIMIFKRRIRVQVIELVYDHEDNKV